MTNEIWAFTSKILSPKEINWYAMGTISAWEWLLVLKPGKVQGWKRDRWKSWIELEIGALVNWHEQLWREFLLY